MKKKAVLSLVLFMILFLPGLCLAECTEIGFFNRFVIEKPQRVILYLGSVPIVRFDVMDCEVKPTSNIELIKSYVCDGNEIMIDGVKCTIMEIVPGSH